MKSVDTHKEPAPGDHMLYDMGFSLHVGGHTTLPEDFALITDFMDLHFTGQAVRK